MSRSRRGRAGWLDYLFFALIFILPAAALFSGRFPRPLRRVVLGAGLAFFALIVGAIAWAIIYGLYRRKHPLPAEERLHHGVSAVLELRAGGRLQARLLESGGEIEIPGAGVLRILGPARGELVRGRKRIPVSDGQVVPLGGDRELTVGIGWTLDEQDPFIGSLHQGQRIVRKLSDTRNGPLYRASGSTVLRLLEPVLDDAALEALRQRIAAAHALAREICPIERVSRDQDGVALVWGPATDGLVQERWQRAPGEVGREVAALAAWLAPLHEAQLAHGNLGNAVRLSTAQGEVFTGAGLGSERTDADMGWLGARLHFGLMSASRSLPLPPELYRLEEWQALAERAPLMEARELAAALTALADQTPLAIDPDDRPVPCPRCGHVALVQHEHVVRMMDGRAADGRMIGGREFAVQSSCAVCRHSEHGSRYEAY